MQCQLRKCHRHRRRPCQPALEISHLPHFSSSASVVAVKEECTHKAQWESNGAPGVVSKLQACADIKQVRQVHAHIIRIGFEQNIVLVTQLVIKYVGCGRMDNAGSVFNQLLNRDIVLWNAMIRGYAKNGACEKALALYYQLKRTDIQPDKFTFPCVLKACAGLSALQEGKRIHDHIVKTGFDSDGCIGDNLIRMYAKCGSVDHARQVFDKMYQRNVVSWSNMIAGYAQNGHASEALTLFHHMTLAGVMPDLVTMAIVLAACANLGALQQGKWIHDYLISRELELDVVVVTALVDMYAKCGSIELARQLFDQMSERDVVSWNAMIAGYGMHGYGEDALALFSQMQQIGMEPDHITFVGILSACSHAGLVDEGWKHFYCMNRAYCITPTVEHYACMVDLLGRAGHLNEAQHFIQTMPVEPDAGVWAALLSSCRIHCNIEMGEWVAKRLFDLEPEHSGYYVLLSNIYAAAGKWDDMESVRTRMKGRGVKKKPGCSFIEINNKVHAFLVADKSHPQSEKIYAMLESLGLQLQEAGYAPNTKFVLHDMEEEEAN